MRRLLSLLLLLALALSGVAPGLPTPLSGAPVAEAQDLPPDYEVPNGRFFPARPDGSGFLIADQGGVPMWSEFRRLGGAAWFGPVMSRRYTWGDRLVQTARSSLLIWAPEQRAVIVGNALDLFHDAGQDDWLLQRYNVPPPLPASFDAGKSPDLIASSRRSLLDATPGIKRLYNSVRDPSVLFGLPTSEPRDFGPYVAVRFQKVVAQEWKGSGQVTLMDLATMLAEAKWIPDEAQTPEPPMALAGQSDRLPWSGWWWPASVASQGPKLYDPGGPLDKYDAFVIALGAPNPQTRQWEWERNRLVGPGLGWAGHCNGWAAASILEPEPTAPITKLGVYFSVADQKGLLTAYHFADLPLWSVGTEFGGLQPHEFHRAVMQWLGRNRKPMIATFFNGPEENWSYPVYRFQTVMGPDPVDPDRTLVRTTLWFATFEVPPDFIGTREWPGPNGRTFTYVLTGPREEPTGGTWTGDSVGGLYGHPGRLWYPDPSTRNQPDPVTSPALTYDFLKQIFR